jgi:hypothetical protein
MIKFRFPSREGLLVARYANAVVLPPGPHKADDLQALLQWYRYVGYWQLWFTSTRAAEQHFKKWLESGHAIDDECD